MRAAYRATAIVLLNTALLLAALELGAGALIAATDRTVSPFEQPYYLSKPWGARFIRDQRAAMRKDLYRPFALWQRPLMSGESVNVFPQGVRSTPGADCSPASYRVLMLGGSTLWGVGSPDWGTIPARLQRALARRTDRPVCVVNLGEKGYTSTQELVLLVTLLGSDPLPDLVIFYDGVNDVRVAAEEGRAGVHYGARHLAAQFERAEPSLAERVSRSSLLSLVRSSRKQPADVLAFQYYREQGISPEWLVDQVVSTHRETRRKVRALAKEFGFESAFFWQPVIWCGAKSLTPEERAIHREAVATMQALYAAACKRTRDVATHEAGFHDIDDTFDGQSQLLYVDWNHVVPEGNELVAARMLEVLDDQAGGKLIPERRTR